MEMENSPMDLLYSRENDAPKSPKWKKDSHTIRQKLNIWITLSKFLLNFIAVKFVASRLTISFCRLFKFSCPLDFRRYFCRIVLLCSSMNFHPFGGSLASISAAAAFRRTIFWNKTDLCCCFMWRIFYRFLSLASFFGVCSKINRVLNALFENHLRCKTFSRAIILFTRDHQSIFERNEV